jgi:alpha-1,2-mannosyltransferase
VSERNSSYALPAPFIAGLSRDMAVLVCFAACLVVSFGVYIAVIKAYSNESIFGAMYRAAFSLEMEDSWWPMLTALAKIKEGQYSGLYDHIFFTDKIKFQYAVTSLLFIDFLSKIFEPTYPNLNIFNFGLMPLIALSLTWLARELGLWQDWRQGVLWTGACGFLTLTFFPIVFALNLGQAQLWIDLLFVLACVLWVRDSRIGAGLLIGLIALMKPQMAALLLWALLRGQWTFLRGFLLATVPLTLLSIYLYGFWNNVEYLGVLSYVSKHGEVYFANQSVNGLLNRVFGDGNNIVFSDQEFAPYDLRVHIATLVSSAILIAIALFTRKATRDDKLGLDFVFAAWSFTIASPIVWEHHYGIAPAMFLVALVAIRDVHSRGRPILGYSILFGLAFVLIAANINAPTNAWRDTPAGTLMQSYRFYGGLMLFALLMMLRKHLAPQPARTAA